MIKKISYYVGKFTGIAFMILVACGTLAMLKIAVYLLKWVFCGTFII